MKTILENKTVAFGGSINFATYTIDETNRCRGVALNNYIHHANKSVHHKRIINSLINLAMMGSYTNTSGCYPKILISHIAIPAAENAKVVRCDDGSLLFKWQDNSGVKDARANDKVILLTYFPALKKTVYTLHPATRASCQAVLKMEEMKGFLAETWIGFVSHDERNAGNSVYAGSVSL